MKEALFYKKLKNKIVQCQLCPNFCVLKENEPGKCLARKNISGKLISLSYGKPIAMNIDPIEKKPFFHFMPGEKVFSIGTAGCTFKCLNCQNFDISQISPEDISTQFVSPEEIIDKVKKSGCKIIAYTYSEPTTMFEYMLDICKLAKKEKIKNVFVSNGYINEKPLQELCKYIDTANIDLKSINNEFYEKICSGKLEPVLKALKILHKNKVWIEITNLIIPRLNDSSKDIEKLCKWVKNLDKNIPIHFSRFFPMYKLLNKPETPNKTLENAYKIAKKQGLKYIYIGNLETDKENTYCPKCNSLLIERNRYQIIKNNIKGDKCYNCNAKIPGVFN
ncbi:MAG: AmmeMemoRadiSam system radical SAM enzyme [Candidatus Nanoarchaeia archaeon]|nr:AmmeMemoRadiSam system radical SAM enzyme [Candidatus Nanoarchaeia archaeon]MDD5587702.1 AmmeMemoRadiSam system radical SAM enzyme [Candidatus Nanoarchaeia archaeon]